MIPLDLQLNGYGGVDFNSDGLSLDDLQRSCAAVRTDGGGRMLATVITDRLDRMIARIARLAELHAADPSAREVMAGIHIEGPFISPLPGYVGAHPVAHAIPAEVSAARQLVEAGRGLVRLVTLAPEHDRGMATTRWLAEQGIFVSAGHCDASLDQLREAVDAGLSGFTHLGNGCPLLMHRHDNIIQRVLMTNGLRWVMVIPDGVHIPPRVLGDYIRRIGIARTIAVTDATAAGGMGPGNYRLAGQDVVVGDDGAAWAADRSHFVGSTASMSFIREVLQKTIGLTAEEVDQVTAVNPSRAIFDAGFV
ncbi:MAG: N-acetylglucosamine-6-phosphate deacetylase [Planctomycetia bacterium]|nr:N-acetylglucosamine-6-phosphate deacetylase [Planctomycetia bacterium]